MSRCRELLLAIFVCIGYGAFSQGLPPGWEFQVTGSSHVISIGNPPLINGNPIQPGDYIGVFFINDQGGESCGGATEWLGGGTAVAISAFGDDNMTPGVKDGFAYGEDFIFRIYSWCAGAEYTNLTAVASPALYGLQWVPEGLTILLALYGTGPVYYPLSGNVQSLGIPLAGVEITFSNGPASAVTDADGNYSRCVPDGWSGDILPVANGYSFDPVSVALTNVTATASSIDFDAYPDITVSGTIAEGSTTLSDVEVVFSNAAGTVYTNSAGMYTNTVEYGWTGTVTPVMTGKTFSPEFRSYAAVNQDYLTEDYTVSPATYTITGTVSDGALPMENVEIQATSHSSVYTGADGQYSITVNYGWTGTLVPFKAGYDFTPLQYSVPAVSGNLSSKDFTGTLIEYFISGTILDDQQQPIQGVSVQFTGDPGTVTTNASGDYSAEVPFGYSGTATPQLAGYTFNPVERTYSNVTAPAEDEDYTGTLQTFSISGTITEDGSPLEGVEVTFSNSGGTVLTDATGFYTITLPYGWLGTSIPSYTGKDFSPESYAYAALTEDQTNQDFTASVAILEISGSITDNDGDAVNGVEMLISGQPSVFSGEQGSYSTTVEYGWTGTVQPQKPGFSFVPGIQNFTNITTDQPGINFTGTIEQFIISGTVTDNESLPVQNVVIQFSNNGGSVITDASGFYSINVDYGYSGSATPMLLGYIFQPDEIIYSNVTQNSPNNDYSALSQNIYVSGYITDSRTGTPVEDAIVFFDNGGGTDTTNYEGYYSMLLPYGWSGTAYPDLDGYTFDPENRSYPSLYLNYGNQNYSAIADYVPAGWEVTPTENSHIISVPIAAQPSINGNSIQNGDFIGVFFWDDATQSERCGGYIEWNGNSAVTAFGNDPSASIKTGFYENEDFRWRIHRRSDAVDFEAIATYSPQGTFSSDGKYHSNALSMLLSLQANDLSVMVSPKETTVCAGTSVVIEAVPAGGSGNYSYSWTSIPAGFTSAEQQISVSPTISTLFRCDVNTYLSNAADNASVDILPLPEAPESVTSDRDDFCANDAGTITLTAVGGSGDVVRWFSGTTDLGTGNPLIIDSPEETTTYCAQWENSCGISTCTDVTVNVLPLPEAPELVTSDRDNFCADDAGTITLTAVGGSGDVVRWFSGATELGTGNPLIIDSPEETTTYCAQWENSCGMSTCTDVTVNVLPLPEAPESVTSDSDNFCADDAGTITLTAVGGSGDVVRWFSGATELGTGNPLIIDSPEETTTYCAQWENSCGMSTCTDVTVNVLPLPEAPELVTATPSEIEISYTGSIILTAEGGSGDALNWYVENNLLGTGTPMATSAPTETTTYCAVWQNSCGVSDCVPVTVNVISGGTSVQIVNLDAGWSGLSSWVVPEDDTTAHIFAPIYDDLVILKNLTDVYWPPYANNIPFWDTWDGYKVKVEAPCQLTFEGEPAQDQSTFLTQGWSLIPVLSSEAVTSTSVFEPLGDNLIIAKGVASPEVYWPTAGFYSLQALQPGKAYMVALDEPAAISYENATPAAKDSPLKITQSPWNTVNPTANSHIIALPNIVTASFNDGDIIGIFNGNGLCVGFTEIDSQQKVQALTVYGDDPTTEVTDGMIENEQMHFRVWRASTYQETSLQAEFNENYPARQWFVSNGIGAVKAFTEMTGIIENTSLSVSVFPVPAKDKLFVDVVADGVYAVEVFTLTGKQLFDKKECKGTTVIATDSMLPGLYMIRINSGSGTAVRRFVVGQ